MERGFYKTPLHFVSSAREERQLLSFLRALKPAENVSEWKQHNTNIRSVRKNIRNVGCVHKDISRP